MVCFFLSPLSPAALAQEVRDVRKVNSVNVDLSPVHQWFRDREGDRPMKHWKRIEVTEVKEPLGSWQKCVVKNEAGDRLELLIQNLPPSIPKHFSDLKQLKSQVDWLRTSLVKSSAVVAVADVTAPTGATGTRDYVEAAMAERYRVELAKLSLEQRRARLVSLTESLNELAAKPQTELAMFTGRKYASLEIWDCGQPVK